MLEIPLWGSTSEPRGSDAKCISSALQKDLLGFVTSRGDTAFQLSVAELSPVGEHSKAAQGRDFSGAPYECSCLNLCVYIYIYIYKISDFRTQKLNPTFKLPKYIFTIS